MTSYYKELTFKTEKGTCSICGAEHASHVYNPYDLEVEKKNVEDCLCEDCFNVECESV